MHAEKFSKIWDHACQNPLYNVYAWCLQRMATTHLLNTINSDSFGDLFCAKIVQRQIYHVKNPRLGHNFQISVNDRVIFSPFREGFIFTKLRTVKFRKNKALAKISELTSTNIAIFVRSDLFPFTQAKLLLPWTIKTIFTRSSQAATACMMSSDRPRNNLSRLYIYTNLFDCKG